MDEWETDVAGLLGAEGRVREKGEATLGGRNTRAQGRETEKGRRAREIGTSRARGELGRREAGQKNRRHRRGHGPEEVRTRSLAFLEGMEGIRKGGLSGREGGKTRGGLGAQREARQCMRESERTKS
ncbi:hypothetical protein ERJ75_000573000 [Trypanosoma vivax]|nr:hypothetical protein ERJ75_000573000 [Trypanosoma vivax]